MKFKDAYQKKNDAVRVREDLLDEIRMEQVERARKERQQKERRRPWLIAIPAIAATAAACIAIVVGVNARNAKNSSASDHQAADASYIQIQDAAAEPEEIKQTAPA